MKPMVLSPWLYCTSYCSPFPILKFHMWYIGVLGSTAVIWSLKFHMWYIGVLGAVHSSHLVFVCLHIITHHTELCALDLLYPSSSWGSSGHILSYSSSLLICLERNYISRNDDRYCPCLHACGYLIFTHHIPDTCYNVSDKAHNHWSAGPCIERNNSWHLL